MKRLFELCLVLGVAACFTVGCEKKAAEVKTETTVTTPEIGHHDRHAQGRDDWRKSAGRQVNRTTRFKSPVWYDQAGFFVPGLFCCAAAGRGLRRRLLRLLQPSRRGQGAVHHDFLA